MIKLAVISVPHTGTQFISNLFLSHPDMGVRIGIDTCKSISDMDGYGLLQGHYGLGQDDLINDVYKLVPVITPVRDPLLSMISHKKRKSQDLNFNSWRILKKFHVERDHNPLYLPVDLLSVLSPKNRLRIIDYLLIEIGLSSHDNIKNYVYTWAKRNTAGTTDLDIAYQQRDRDYLLEKMPEEMQILSGAQDLKPMLHDIGYRDFLW